MKVCSRCRVEKPHSEYHKSSKMKDGVQSSCKSCMAESYKRSRMQRYDHYKFIAKQRGNRNVELFSQWKAKQCCCKCGESEASCLDLHHLDPSEKEVTVSNVTRYWSWDRLMKEVDKCIVVCSNCHRKIHAGIISV